MTRRSDVPPVLAPGEDESTAAYFDDHVPEYSTLRLEHAASYIAEHGGPESSLIDIGCGVGNTLAFLVERTGVSNVAGLDVSANCLVQTREQVPCETYQGSILDPELVSSLEGRFDFAVLAAVVHHLIGATRGRSLGFAEAAIHNAVRLVKPGGHVVVHEPVYSPRAFSASLFYVKKGVTAITSKRVELGNQWSNVGPPVVSYLTNDQLREFANRAPQAELAGMWIEPAEPPPIAKLLFRHTDTTVALRRDPAAAAHR
ncbi:MAG: class I SAM-dependent methyltransferase [Solirubrobacterales bacterium]